ncbi:MAG: FKBP-type peptidyl-prolyl cis-trans isomerase [Bacteroidales bacterium]|nr:FKBP-type peptidyl-prolyl cis-trans isomerase [Bacteroidales bacterium]
MSLRFQLIACLALLVVLAAGCSRCSDAPDAQRPRPTREQFIRYNRHLVRCDSICIAQYSDSFGLNATPSPTNLWLTVHEQGSGDAIKSGDKVSIEYVVTTLLADTIYTSAANGVKTITVGRAEMTMGLDEALCQLHRGTRATVILIPEKAYGIRGDGEAIHGRMILRYDIHVLNQ